MTTDDQFLADLQLRSDRIHRQSHDADRPPANMWAGIIASVATESTTREEEEMTTIAMPQSVSTTPVNSESHRPVTWFFNIAASVLIIAALAFGGWFAAMQLNSPGTPTPEPRFAAIATPDASATPQTDSATCDVEPLSVDRVVQIVENPYRFVANGAAGEPTEFDSSTNLRNVDLYEAEGWELSLEPQNGTQPPGDDEFQEASEVADAYLNCLAFGTVGQAWTFSNPIYIQDEVLMNFPVYADRESVRNWIEERIDEPAYQSSYQIPWENLMDIYKPESISVNPDPALTLSQASASSQFDQLIEFGVSLVDADGKVVYLTTGTGNQLVSKPQGSTLNLTVMLAHHRHGDSWYVVPFWNP